MGKFQGQGSNTCHRSDASHGRDDAGYLTPWATRGLLGNLLKVDEEKQDEETHV